MACDFDLQLKDTPETFLEKAQSLTRKFNGGLEGDIKSGNFHLSTPFGSVAGSYTTAAAVVHIVITDKPFFMSCDNVAELMRSRLT
jgi:hypothetical protein